MGTSNNSSMLAMLATKKANLASNCSKLSRHNQQLWSVSRNET